MAKMSKESKTSRVDRRTFLKYAGGTAALAVVAAAGYNFGLLPIARAVTITDRLPDVFSEKAARDAGSLKDACSTIIVGREASAQGSVLMAHNEDLESWDLATVRIVPRRTHDPGEFYQSYYGAMIPQVRETHGFTFFGCPDRDHVPGDVYFGMNEYQVTISSNFGGYPKEEREASTPTKMIWSDFMRLALERSKTAEEAVRLIGGLVETYGLADDPGMMYGVADKNEGWWIETTPWHWIAVRVPDDGYMARANQYRIGTEYDSAHASADIQSIARDKGWWDGTTPFNFRKVWTRTGHLDDPYDKLREDRIDALLGPKVGSIRVEDLKATMRDHLEGTQRYHVDKNGSPHYDNPYRTICMERTVAGFVAEPRSFLPDPLGGLMWITLGCPCTGAYMPLYVGTQSVPKPFTTGLAGAGNYDPASAWWTFKRLQLTIDCNYSAAIGQVRPVLRSFEKDSKNDSKTVEQKALAAYNTGRTQDALSILTAFTTKKLQDGFRLLKDMTVYAEAKPHNRRRILFE